MLLIIGVLAFWLSGFIAGLVWRDWAEGRERSNNDWVSNNYYYGYDPGENPYDEDLKL